MRDDIDWESTTWEGHRKRQHEDFLALSFREKMVRIEEMGRAVAMLGRRVSEPAAPSSTSYASDRPGSTDEATAYAHSLPERPPSEWERLEVHLDQVGQLARTFTGEFGSGDWGRLAGMWHDLGKYRAEFQRRIRGERINAPHAGAGAALAYPVAPPLAFAIAGHHAGLANHAAQGDSSQTPLRRVVDESAGVLAEVRAVAPRSILEQDRPPIPKWLQTRDAAQTLRLELWTRFLFSALVDADRLATERFYEPAKRDALIYDTISHLRAAVDMHLDAFLPDSPVNVMRAAVLEQCRKAADSTPGLFSLSVPTGGGKTLASMSFGLRHAERHGLRRVIVVVPYTSIIEQNAQVYRAVLGENNVIEHHSAIDEEARERAAPEIEVRRRLAAENWDAPIIVTTAVQFFETLFNNEPSRCRKLHNVAKSVVIVDEAQALPTDFLLTLLDGMRQLTAYYGCSLVLSTATQPALNARPALPQGLTGVREIIDEPAILAASLRRVRVTWPDDAAVVSYERIAQAMRDRRQALAIVHKRPDARRLAELLPDDGRYHLSTRMCAAHRLETLAALKSALERQAVCRVVSTQLVEAGVDLSFPVVYRAMAGLDSLAQAAGRCNRNGELANEDGTPALGEFVVFRAESAPPRGVLQRGLDVVDAMLRTKGALDFSDSETLQEYFRGLYAGSQLDRRGVMAERDLFNFATVAQRVRFIEQGTRPLIVPWGDWEARVRAFEASLGWTPSGSRKAARALQPFVVQVYQHELRLLERQGAVAALEGFGHVLTPPFMHLYHQEFGLTLDADATADALALIV